MMYLNAFYFAFLLGLAVYDYKHRLILNKVIVPAIIVAIIAIVTIREINVQESFIGFLIGGGLFLMGAFFDKVGGGDVKLMAFVGLVEGYNIFLVIWLMTLFIFLTLLITRKKKQAVPLAPYAFLAVITSFCIDLFLKGGI